LRFVLRSTFAASCYWPPPLCASCSHRPICGNLLREAERGETWLVRGNYAASSDGHAVDRCARKWTQGSEPADMRVLHHRESADLQLFAGGLSAIPKRLRELRRALEVGTRLPPLEAPRVPESGQDAPVSPVPID
jgi:hypothetical protein